MPIDPISLVATELSPELALVAGHMKFIDPPSMVRLEPDSITGDPAPGAEARIADAAWMLGRQWQFGELIGEDAGTVVAVTVDSRAIPVTAWAALGDGTEIEDAVWRPWRAGALLEELAQDVPELEFGAGLRQRAEAGQQLVELLEDAGESALAGRLAELYPLSLPPDPLSPESPVAGETDEQRIAREAIVSGRDALDPTAKRLLHALGGAVPDGGALRAELSAGEPAWVAEASDPALARAVLAAWLDWLTGDPDSGGAWALERLEYRFAVRFGDEAEAVVARATQFGAATVRWSDLEWIPGAHPALPDGAADGAPVLSTATMLATPLRYPAMPADRYWQLEDGRVDLGAIDAQAYDLARLCLAEFAMSSGDDWLEVPLDGLLGAINQVISVSLRDDFGESVQATELSDPAFRMFRVSSSSGQLVPGILLAPVAADIQAGAAVEEILFLRDEMANMAWAIEQTVQGRSGDPRARSAEKQPEPDPWPSGLTSEERVYRLQTPVPEHWIPLVPVALQPGAISLRKGAMIRSVIAPDGTRGFGDGQEITPLGVTMRPRPLTFPGEEIPREGIGVRAVPMLARRADGRYVTWTGYRVGAGTGEASSRLAWDAALSVVEMRPPSTGGN